MTIVLGFIGWRLSLKINIPELWTGPHPARSRLIYPALLGITIGIFWVLTDLYMQRQAHASFPGVIFLYTYAAIFAEVINRLFLATFLVWLVSIVILRGRALGRTYWTVAILITLWTSLASAYGTYQASGGNPSWLDVFSSFGLAAVFEPVAFYLYRRYGFLAPLVMHYAFYVIWHMLWGGLVMQVLQS